jgi:hypothetical protein
MSDLTSSDVQDGALIFSPVFEGTIFEEFCTKKILRADDWEVDDDGRRAWEMSFLDLLNESLWSPKAGYVYESDLADHFQYKRLQGKNRTDLMPSVINLQVPIRFKRKVWQHGNGVQITVERGGKGTIMVLVIGEDVSYVHASILTPNVQQTTLDSRVGRFINTKTFTFVTLDAKSEPVDVEVQLLISGKM